MPKLEELLAENERLKAELKHRDEVLRERDEKVAQLEYQLEYLRKKLFGTGRSEKLDARQQELLLGQIEELEKELETTTSVPAHDRRKRAPLPLDGYAGLLQTDAYAPYLSFAQNNDEVTLLGCMAHVRRKFFQARNYHRRECDLVLAQIAQLYRIEKDIREAETPLAPEQVEAIRQRRCPHRLARLKRTMEIIQRNSRPQDPVCKACHYALGIWESLTEYVNHGQAQIDNNLVENAIRPTAVGKKNWLFIGHPSAGDRATIIYSILISCQRFGIDPQQYLRFVFEQDTRSMSSEQIAAITPKAYAQAIAAAQAA